MGKTNTKKKAAEEVEICLKSIGKKKLKGSTVTTT
jgi:hypothetical protein